MRLLRVLRSMQYWLDRQVEHCSRLCCQSTWEHETWFTRERKGRRTRYEKKIPDLISILNPAWSESSLLLFSTHWFFTASTLVHHNLVVTEYKSNPLCTPHRYFSILLFFWFLLWAADDFVHSPIVGVPVPPSGWKGTSVVGHFRRKKLISSTKSKGK